MGTEFRFLNKVIKPHLEIGLVNDGGVMKSKIDQIFDHHEPGGGTPLCRHLNEIADEIDRMTPRLLTEGKQVAVIIFTDGCANDGDLYKTLKRLENKPCYLVIRLCTDDTAVVDYYNMLDNRLEVRMDVLDDYVGECKEVRKMNPWLVYGLPLQRFREFGCHIKCFDLLDECPLG